MPDAPDVQQPWQDALPLDDSQKKNRLGLNIPKLLGPLAALRTPQAAPAATTAPLSQFGTQDSSLAVKPIEQRPISEISTNINGVGGERNVNRSPTGDHGGVSRPTPGLASAQADKRPSLAITPANSALAQPDLAASPAQRSTDTLLAVQPRAELPRLGFRERQALPTTSPGAPAGSAAFYQNKIERIEDQKANPWGSPENHPGFAGKVGHVLGKIGNIAGDIYAPNVMANIPGTDLNRNLQERKLEDRFETASTRENRATETEEQRRIEERRNEVLDRRNDILEGKQPKLTPDESAIADLQKQINPKTGRPYSAYESRVKLAQDIQDTKPGGHTSPFEAFAYGTPEERQAAQDFMDYEKRIGAKYRTPNEFDLRYKLFREDPNTYRAMYGDKGAAADERQRIADRAHATSMLKFFQRQRDEISKNFMLGDDEKAQKLAEIDEMERPFKDAATMSETGDRVNVTGDRVSVIDPNGRPGTIPRGQLETAKRKGYRVAQ